MTFFAKKISQNSALIYDILIYKKLLKACDLFFYFCQKRLTLVLGVTQYSPLFFPIAIQAPKKQKMFILAYVFSKLLHSNTNLTQLKMSLSNQYVCVVQQ